MLRNFKKLISLVLVLALSVVISLPAFATTTEVTGSAILQQSDGTYKNSALSNPGSVKINALSNGMYQSNDGAFFSKVNGDTFIKEKEVNIPLTGESAVESAIQNNNVQNETAQYILNVISSSQKNHTSLDSIKVYVPMTTSSTRTYKGYGNKTYYEEIVTFKEATNPKNIADSTWDEYSKAVIEGVVNKVVSDAMDKVTLGVFSIASIFAVPSGISHYSEVQHYAVLHEEKTAKHTYVVENGQYYFGALTESDAAYFANSLVFPGVDKKDEQGKNTSLSTQKTPNYSAPDKKAYYNYLSSGWVETIDSYDYNGVNFPSATAE